MPDLTVVDLVRIFAKVKASRLTLLFCQAKEENKLAVTLRIKVKCDLRILKARAFDAVWTDSLLLRRGCSADHGTSVRHGLWRR